MTVSDVTLANKLIQSIRDCVGHRHCLELLRFFGKHPNTRFSRLALVRLAASDENNGRLKIETALGHLIDKGMVKTYIENNIRLYSLTEDGSLRSLALEMAKYYGRTSDISHTDDLYLKSGIHLH